MEDSGELPGKSLMDVPTRDWNTIRRIQEMGSCVSKTVGVLAVLLAGVPLCVWLYICAMYTGWLAAYYPPGENEVWGRRFVLHTVLFLASVLATVTAITVIICLKGRDGRTAGPADNTDTAERN